MFNSPTAFAQEPDAKNSLPIKANPTATVSKACNMKDKSSFDAMIYATCYSERYQAVTVVVSGNAQGMSGYKVGQHITNELGKSFVPAVMFLEHQERTKIAISYLLNGDFYGPYSGYNWKEGKKILVLHSAQAWHQEPK